MRENKQIVIAVYILFQNDFTRLVPLLLPLLVVL
jgi:hypothetical protein